MILIIDNYDSFTYNLVQRLGEYDDSLDIRVFRNDKISLDEIAQLQPQRLILSPGPCTPDEAGICLACVKRFLGKIPLLGVCLGHQSIAQATGAEIVAAGRLMHGKTDLIHHDNAGLFAGLPNPLTATRYHSLAVRPETLSPDFTVAAWTEEPGGGREIMAIRHKTLPVFGWQFHPESFLTDHGPELLQRFLESPMSA